MLVCCCLDTDCHDNLWKLPWIARMEKKEKGKEKAPATTPSPKLLDSEEDLPEISPEEIRLEEEIGEGAFAKVYRGKCRGQPVAVKVLHRQTLSEEDLDSFRAEVRIMSKLYHPNVVLFMGACTIPGSMSIVTEILPMDLETLLIGNKADIPLIQKMRMAKDAALGMNWLHSSKPQFIHRDLKLSNLLVTKDNRVKVCDFGLTKVRPAEKVLHGAQGSPLYMAPEVFTGCFDEKCDVYSFGLTLWEMVYQTHVYPRFSDCLPALIHAICDKNERPEITDDLLPRLAKLMNACWRKDPSKRPSFAIVIEKLDEIIVDLAVEDKGARKFWKKHFLGKEKASFDAFLLQFCRAFKRELPKNIESDSKLLCLKAVLAEEGKGISGDGLHVSLETFGRMCGWFGPFIQNNSFEATEKSSESNEAFFLNNIKRTVQAPWFHGDIASKEAEEKLQLCKPGAFLIRFSSQPGCFTISSITKKRKIVHQRIMYNPGKGFTFWENRYSSLSNLIKAEKVKQHWKTPCPGSRFKDLQVKGKTSKKVEGYTDVQELKESAKKSLKKK
ncbi:Dual specificity protein kinase [Balamuthia mandrillaris]